MCFLECLVVDSHGLGSQCRSLGDLKQSLPSLWYGFPEVSFLAIQGQLFGKEAAGLSSGKYPVYANTELSCDIPPPLAGG